MSFGRVTVPTDKNFIDGTCRVMKQWGADAIRDCDGTELPEDTSVFGDVKVYKTYFLARGNNAWAYAHDDFLQNIALLSQRVLAVESILEINPMEDYYKDQVSINDSDNPKEYWQVFDRTAGKEIKDWRYDYKSKRVVIENAIPMHEYTVSFFAKSLWDATQIYNYTTNGWTCEKDRDIDPIFPEAKEIMAKDLGKWLEENPQVSVVRFTTFFYHFFLVRNKDSKQKYFDWFGYATTASPSMFKLFERKFGYKIMIEDIVDGGYYCNCFRMPTDTFKKYMELVEEFVCNTMKDYVDIVHSYGREAMMFLGDNWIGGEPYGKYFSDMGLDAVVGSVNSGATARMLSEIPFVKYREARFLPYFFPDTLNNDDNASAELLRGWAAARRAIMRKPVERIGFGGYLSLADKFPKFMQTIENICKEFRSIYDASNGGKPFGAARVAILNCWGKVRSWMNHMICQDAPYQKIRRYQGVLESLAGLPIDVDFINFEDVKNEDLSKYDVILNYGDRDTAFSGGENWKDEKVLEKIRKYVYNGGGFIGIGEPTSTYNGGRFFALGDVLGVEEENSLSLIEHKYNYSVTGNHFIFEDNKHQIDYNDGVDNIFAFDGTEILDIVPDKNMGLGINAGHVRAAANSFGKGRSFYMCGFKYNGENTRLLYRAILWCAHKEEFVTKNFVTNINCDCNYYAGKGMYAIINNTSQKVVTDFYDNNGKTQNVELYPYEVKWFYDI